MHAESRLDMVHSSPTFVLSSQGCCVPQVEPLGLAGGLTSGAESVFGHESTL